LEIRDQLYSHQQLGKPLVTTDITIPVAFHIVHKTNGDGYITSEKAEAVITRLNAVYFDSHFQFEYFSIDYTENDDWASSWNYEHTMKRNLAINPAKILNFYSVHHIYTNPQDRGFVTGYAYTPDQLHETHLSHGVVMLSSYFSDDKTTDIHEVGHYLGLEHTFKNGCTYPGDDVDDTAYHDDGDLKWTCDENLDTCPNKDGKDPVYNYMGYTNCRNEFTNGQYERMNKMVAVYKPSLISSEVLVEQRRKDNRLIDDYVDEWNGNEFVNHFRSFKFPYIEGETKVLRGSHSLLQNPSEKYYKWTGNGKKDEADVTNHHTFIINPSIKTLTSRFNEVHNVTIQIEYIGSASNEGEIKFKDPWYRDFTDDKGLRNRGMDAIYHSQPSPFHITTQSGYQGVFLEQGYNNPNKPYYSIAAQKHHATSDAIYEFSHWQATPANSATFQNENSRQTPVVFKQGNATVTAVYALI
jgi:hypothetical protein